MAPLCQFLVVKSDCLADHLFKCSRLIEWQIPTCSLMLQVSPGCLVTYQYGFTVCEGFKNGMTEVFPTRWQRKNMVHCEKCRYVFIGYLPCEMHPYPVRERIGNFPARCCIIFIFFTTDNR